MRVITVTQADIDKLPQAQRASAKAIVDILATRNTAIEQMLGIEVVWVDATSPATVPVSAPSVVTCGCDLSGPLVDPPFSHAYLKSRGNAEECPVPGGRDIRTRVRYPSEGSDKCKSIGSLWPAKEFVSNPDKTITAKCVERDGYQYHVVGWSHSDSDWKDRQAGNTFKYRGTMFIFAECRKAGK